MSSRARATNSACVSVFGNSASIWLGEGRARVSRTLMSEVFRTSHHGAADGSFGKPHGPHDTTDRIRLGQRKGGPPTPKRPAIAFLVTPKLPLGGRSENFD